MAREREEIKADAERLRRDRQRLERDSKRVLSALPTKKERTEIENLREKLGDFAKHIQTVRGVGYRFVEAADSSEA